MLSLVRQSARVVTACVLVTIFAVPPSLLAQAQIHVVSPADLHHATVAASETRQHNLDTVSNFLSSPAAQIALTSAHMDSAKVKAAVSSLSDEELAQLASRAQLAAELCDLRHRWRDDPGERPRYGWRNCAPSTRPMCRSCRGN